MPAKLTLYIEENLISYVKNYARENHLSVSRVVNNFLAILKQETGKQTKKKIEKPAPITESLKGILAESDIDISDYQKHLESKYL